MERFLISAPFVLQEAFHDPSVTDICINGTQSLFIDTGYSMKKIEHVFSSEEDLKEWVLQILNHMGKSWDAKYPFIDGMLSSGHRIHILFPPISQMGIVISIRKLSRFSPSSEALERWKMSPFFLHLIQAIKKKECIFISGATNSGKTTLANDLLSFISVEERIIALEDTPELQPCHPHFISLLSRPPNADGFGEITLQMLLKQSLRMRPDRIVIGECRGHEVIDLLQALNTGHKGAVATLHANSGREALKRMELLCLLSSHGIISLQAIRELLALGVQWVAHVSKQNGHRQIQELWKVEGREGENILMRSISEK